MAVNLKNHITCWWIVTSRSNNLPKDKDFNERIGREEHRIVNDCVDRKTKVLYENGRFPGIINYSYFINVVFFEFGNKSKNIKIVFSVTRLLFFIYYNATTAFRSLKNNNKLRKVMAPKKKQNQEQPASSEIYWSL